MDAEGPANRYSENRDDRGQQEDRNNQYRQEGNNDNTNRQEFSYGQKSFFNNPAGSNSQNTNKPFFSGNATNGRDDKSFFVPPADTIKSDPQPAPAHQSRFFNSDPAQPSNPPKQTPAPQQSDPPAQSTAFFTKPQHPSSADQSTTPAPPLPTSFFKADHQTTLTPVPLAGRGSNDPEESTPRKYSVERREDGKSQGNLATRPPDSAEVEKFYW